MRDDPVLLGFTVTVFLITVCVRGRVQESWKSAGKLKGQFPGLEKYWENSIATICLMSP